MYSVLTYFCKICKLELPPFPLPPMFLKRASKLIILHAPQNSALVREADWVLMDSSSRLANARREIVSRRLSDCLVFGVARGPFLGVRSRPASPANRGWRRQGKPAQGWWRSGVAARVPPPGWWADEEAPLRWDGCTCK